MHILVAPPSYLPDAKGQRSKGAKEPTASRVEIVGVGEARGCYV